MLYVIAIVVLAVDQTLKWLVRTHMTVGHSFPIWNHVLYIDSVRNAGGAFSILEGAQWLFILVAVVVIVVVIRIDRKYQPLLWTKIGLALVLGGAIGNLTDRILYGSVVDYVYFKVINFPVFNAADVAITIGVPLLLIRSMMKPPDRDGQNKDVLS